MVRLCSCGERKAKEIHGINVQGGWHSEKKTTIAHSLRATGATALFNAGVPENLIQDVTGHRSSCTNAL